MKAAQNKIKKSYSLSVESERYVRRYRRARKIASDSEALDTLLKEALAAEKLAEINAAYKDYYDNATEEELKEESDWAQFASAALAEVPWNG